VEYSAGVDREQIFKKFSQAKSVWDRLPSRRFRESTAVTSGNDMDDGHSLDERLR
jgi:hypothetical protein